MENNMITEAMVDVAIEAAEDAHAMGATVTRPMMRAALEAALTLSPAAQPSSIPRVGDRQYLGDFSPAAQGKAEPVAWRYRYELDGGRGWQDWIASDIDPKDWDWAPAWVNMQSQPLFTHPSPPSISAGRDEGLKATHRHKESGSEYVLIGYGKMQAPPQWSVWPFYGPQSSVDMREVAIYRSAIDPTEIWVRPREEFEDGRFEDLRSAKGSQP